MVELHNWALTRDTETGPRVVLDDIDFVLRRGEWLAVLGANGSGKSSLLRYLATAPSVVAGRSALISQDPDEQLVTASVAEELSLGHDDLDVEYWLSAFGLSDSANLDPRLLSAGQKQRLQLAVVEVARPEIMLCDEPTSLQDPAQATWVIDRLQLWRRLSGGTIVTATQDHRELAAADLVLVLRDSKQVLFGPAVELADHPLVTDLLGPPRIPRDIAPEVRPQIAAEASVEAPTEAPAEAPMRRRPSSDLASRGVATPIVRWEQVSCRFAAAGSASTALGPDARGFDGVNLEIQAGQRIGITGPNGCGKSSLLAIAAGLRPPASGILSVAGHRLYKGQRRDLDHGCAMLAPQFPEYGFSRSTVTAEIKLDAVLAGREVAEVLAQVGLDPELASRDPYELSSGQRRRLALVLTLLSQRPLLLLDEPAAALDRCGRRLVRELMDAVTAEAALVIASPDTAFLRACGCRVLRLTTTGLTDEDESSPADSRTVRSQRGESS